MKLDLAAMFGPAQAGGALTFSTDDATSMLWL